MREENPQVFLRAGGIAAKKKSQESRDRVLAEGISCICSRGGVEAVVIESVFSICRAAGPIHLYAHSCRFLGHIVSGTICGAENEARYPINYIFTITHEH